MQTWKFYKNIQVAKKKKKKEMAENDKKLRKKLKLRW